MSLEFTATEIRRLFDALEAELGRRGVGASMYVVGGAAIALAHEAGRRTQDVDAALVPRDPVLEAAAVVADAEGIPSSWLNTDAAWWIPSATTTAAEPAPIKGLRIEIASPQVLLAMKLVASRNRDLPDIKLLAESISVTTAREMADLVQEQYGEDQLQAVHGGYEDMLLWCEQLVAMFWLPR